MPQDNDKDSRHPLNLQESPPSPLPHNILKKDDEALERDKKLKELENR